MLKRVNKKRIIYGTAKIGNPNYGFSSKKHKSLENQVDFIKKIIKFGINRFDTSPRYGNAEIILGNSIKGLKNNPIVDTKIIDLNPHDKNIESIILNQVQTSLKRLNINKINVLYLHQNELEIISNKIIQKTLEKVLNMGFANSLGISVYSLDEFNYGLNSEIYKTIQAPLNILNHSFYESFIKNNLKKELIARSIFIQGTLLNTNFKKIRQLNLELYNSIYNLYNVCESHNTTVLNEAKSSVFSLEKINIIQSSLSLKNIKSNLNYDISKSKLILKSIIKHMDSGYTFTNPRNWS